MGTGCMAGVEFLAGEKYFSILHCFYTGSEATPTGTGESLRWWDSAVGIATGYGRDGRPGVGVRVAAGARIFSMSSRPVLGSNQPPIEWVPVVPSTEEKRQSSEANYSPPTSIEVKKM
jgi:hypothetical protein